MFAFYRNRASGEIVQSETSIEPERVIAGPSNGQGSPEQGSPALPTDTQSIVPISDEQRSTRNESGTASQNVPNSSMTQGHRPRRIVDHVCEIETHPLLSSNDRSSSQDAEEHIGEDPIIRVHCTSFT